MKLLERITLNPDICHGKPCIRNMRYPVAMILDLLASGMTNKEILKDYSALQEADIKATLLFASNLTKFKSVKRIA